MIPTLTRFSGFGAGFSPASIPSLALWLRADGNVYYSGTTQCTNAQDVATWVDGSVNGYNATEATNKPVFYTGLYNGLPGILYNGSNDILRLGGSTNLGRNVSGCSIFAVVDSASTTQVGKQFVSISSSTLGNNRCVLRTGSVANKWSFGGRCLDADSAVLSNSSAASTTNPTALCAIFDYSVKKAYLYVNGVLDTTIDPFQTATTTSNTAPANVGIGAGCDNTNWWNGYIMEVCIYNKALTSGEGTKLYTYAKSKWAL